MFDEDKIMDTIYILFIILMLGLAGLMYTNLKDQYIDVQIKEKLLYSEDVNIEEFLKGENKYD